MADTTTDSLAEAARAFAIPEARLVQAREFLARHPAVDLHCDTIAHALADGPPGDPVGHAAPDDLVAGGFGAAVYAFWIPAHLGSERGWARALTMMDALERLRERRRAVGTGGLTLLPALEDARVLIGHPDRVEALARWRPAYVSLTWNVGNAWATSCEDSRPGGLTEDGRELIARLNAEGVPIDLSHASDATAFDVISAATLPPLASHSSARARHPHPRNVSDAIAHAIADRGGIIGVNVFPVFLSRTIRNATLDDVVTHLEHLWRVAGTDALALGSDFDGIPFGPSGFEGAARFPLLVARLLERGHPPAHVAAFAGDNARRFLGLTGGGHA